VVGITVVRHDAEAPVRRVAVVAGAAEPEIHGARATPLLQALERRRPAAVRPFPRCPRPRGPERAQMPHLGFEVEHRWYPRSEKVYGRARVHTLLERWPK